MGLLLSSYDEGEDKQRSLLSLPLEDGNRHSFFRDLIFFRIPDERKTPRTPLY
jgi:hypothetical protein